MDICRIIARVRLRQRRLSEAQELLKRVVTVSPHSAGDWVALATIQMELGDLEGRDLSVIRALLIEPGKPLPPTLSSVREQLGLV